MKLILRLLLTLLLMMITFLNVMMLLMPGLYVQWAINLAVTSAVTCSIVTCVMILENASKKRRPKKTPPFICDPYDEDSVMYDGFINRMSQQPLPGFTNERIDRR